MTEHKDATDLKGKTGIVRLMNAFGYSKDGFLAAYRNEEAFRQEFWLLIIATVVVCFLPVTLSQAAAVIAAHLFLLIVEILNSAIEACIDRIGPELQPLSKRAKDMGSCAVLMACFAVAGTWLLVLWQTFFI